MSTAGMNHLMGHREICVAIWKSLAGNDKKKSWGLGMMATFAGERVASTIRTIDRTLTPICNRFMSQALPASSQLESQESGKDDSRISHMESHLQTRRDLLERYCHGSRNWQGLQGKFLGQAGSSSVSDASRKTG